MPQESSTLPHLTYLGPGLSGSPWCTRHIFHTGVRHPASAERETETETRIGRQTDIEEVTATKKKGTSS